MIVLLSNIKPSSQNKNSNVVHNLKFVVLIVTSGEVTGYSVYTSPNGDMTFNCTTCNKVYKHKTSLYKHLKYECNKEPQFSCHLCSYKAKRATSLRSHLYLKHKLML